MTSEAKPTVEVVEKGFTTRAIIIGIILLVSFTFMRTLTVMSITFSQPNPYLQAMYFLFPLLIILAFIQQRVNFKGAELAVLFTMLFWACFTYQLAPREMAWSYLYGGKYGWTGIVEATRPWVAKVVPPFWGQAWFWIIGTLLFIYMGIFYTYIWRRQILDVERLAFPISQVPIATMQAAIGKNEKGRSALLHNAVFWAGILLALVWTIPQWVSITTRLFNIPSPIKIGYGTGWAEPKDSETAVVLGAGSLSYTVDLTPALYTVLPNADARFIIGLAHIAIGYFLPTDVAISATIAWLLFWWIIPPIQVAMQIFPALSRPGTMAYWGWSMINIYDPRGLILSYSVMWAVPFALGITPLILHRRYVVETIRAAIKGTKSGVEGWQDPYRLYWLGFIACFIASIAWGITLGAAFLAVLFVVAFSWVMFGGLMRVGGEGWAFSVTSPVGGAFLSVESIAIASPGYPAVPAERNLTTLATSNFAAIRGYAYDASFNASPGGWGDGIGVMRVGQHLRGRLNEILICTAIAILVGSVVTAITTEWYKSMYPYRYGVTMHVSTAYGGGWGQVEQASYDMATASKQWSYFGGGVVLWSIIMLLRMRFAWFIINPVGFLLPMNTLGFGINCFGITIAWILKLLALRIGGPKIVDKVQWLFVGSIIGLSMVTFYGIVANLFLSWGQPTCACGA